MKTISMLWNSLVTFILSPYLVIKYRNRLQAALDFINHHKDEIETLSALKQQVERLLALAEKQHDEIASKDEVLNAYAKELEALRAAEDYTVHHTEQLAPGEPDPRD